MLQNALGSAPEDTLFPSKLGAVWRAHVEGAQGSMVGLKEGAHMHVPRPTLIINQSSAPNRPAGNSVNSPAARTGCLPLTSADRCICVSACLCPLLLASRHAGSEHAVTSTQASPWDTVWRGDCVALVPWGLLSCNRFLADVIGLL